MAEYGTREWRALAVGYAAALIAMSFFGASWVVPVAATLSGFLCYGFWRS